MKRATHYIEFTCNHDECKFEFNDAHIEENGAYVFECRNCGKDNQIILYVTAVGLPLKED